MENLENKETMEEKLTEDNQAAENEAPAKAETTDERKDKNQIYFRGVVRAISQELDAEDRVQNATVITTPATETQDYKSSGTVTIYWGDNERAKKKLGEIEVGDHVIIQAQLRTYQTDISRGSFFYGVMAEKETPGGLSGFGEYETDRNEGIFIGSLKSVYKVNDYFTLLNMVTHTRLEGKDINAHPTFNIGGPLLVAYNRNVEKFAVGKRIGAVCQIRQRMDKRTGKEQNEWKCFGLMYEDEDGEMKALNVPMPVRRSNPNRRRRVRAMARSTAEEDLSRVSKEQTSSAENVVAEGSKPASDNLEEVLESIE